MGDDEEVTTIRKLIIGLVKLAVQRHLIFALTVGGKVGVQNKTVQAVENWQAWHIE